jgi:thiamine pyrophosphate-dependent acetolactate synthase large subunit-like protein
LAPKINEEIVITNLAGVAREWFNLCERDGNLYSPYLGQATAIALGLALALPHRRVISLDGDGSLLLDLTILPVIARQSPPNFIVVVFDNEAYEAPGGVPSHTAWGTDLAGMARAAGVKNANVVKNTAEFKETIDTALKKQKTHFINAKVKMSKRKTPYGTLVGVENKYRLIRYIEKSENIQILKPPTKALPWEKRRAINKTI